MMSTYNQLLTKNRSLLSLFQFIRTQTACLSSTVAAKNVEINQNLPSLPVPKLNQTLEKYLKSVQPFLNDTELNRTKQLLNEFSSENGVGTKLQKLLELKAQNSENWLADWWLNSAYLDYRDPVVVYSSPGLVFPAEDFGNDDERLVYTAKLILAALDYKSTIDSNRMPMDRMGKEPLDMNQYKKIFGTCRVPGLKRDSLQYNPKSSHIIIARNNNFFKLQVLIHDKMPSLTEMISFLQDIWEQSTEMGPAVGILTSDNRNNWGKAYENLIKNPVNKKSVSEIQSSLFLVCLDNPMPQYNENLFTSASHQLIHGGGSNGNSANRWFDKTVQFVIGEDGIVGLTYEHSPSEGQPIAVMTDYLIEYIKHGGADYLHDIQFDNEAERLEFQIDTATQEAINIASANIDELVNNLDMDSFKFETYGKEFVKAQKLSPDSLIQIAMQYAFYRLHKTPGAHYESAATRKYLHGRTETIRSCSVESIAYAKAMLDKTKTDRERYLALKEAINSHKKYSVEAVNGFGVDRHLLGLKLIALENGLEIPELFKDPSFTRSTHMRISSSQVATKCDGFMCYAPLVPDGYGCCYNPRNYDINFGVSAFSAHPDTSASKYRQALEESLNDMFNILLKTVQSKL